MKISSPHKIRLFVFLISFAIFFGANYNVYLSYERFYNPDSETYMNIANGDFKGQSLVRRYRVIVPFMAKGVSELINPFYYKIFKEHREKYDWPLITGFYLINCILLALSALIIFEILQSYKLSISAQAMAMLAFIVGGRWQGIIAAHPIVDSLYVLVIALLILGIQKQSLFFIGLAILLGPFSKESFLFFIPLLFIYTNKLRLRILILLIISYTLHIFCRYLIDTQDATNIASSAITDTSHIYSIIISIHKFLSIKGWLDIFSVYGFFSFIIVACLLKKQFYIYIISKFNFYYLCFGIIILIHALLSSEIGRMLYAGSALFIPFIGICFNFIVTPSKPLLATNINLDN